jgi:hypothetical protein
MNADIDRLRELAGLPTPGPYDDEFARLARKVVPLLFAKLDSPQQAPKIERSKKDR